MFRGLHHALYDVAIEGGTGGAPASVADAIGASNPTQPSQTGDQDSQPSVLSTGTEQQKAPDQQNQNFSFPEKCTVKNEDGSVNNEASTQKLLESYTHLSKRMGETGGLVPTSADGYKIEFDQEALGFPESVTPELLRADPDFKRFSEEAHKAGFTNEQMNLVAKEYLGVVRDLVDRRYENDLNACKTELMETWKTPDEMSTGINNALKAFNHFASDQDKALIDTIGNNPLVVRLLANIGATMREDAPARNTQPPESRETITSLMKSEAYHDPKHPDHDRVTQQVKQYYRQTVGDEVIY
ncbi:hypothetical protein PT276_08125 [Orbaceae bacterium ESL0721]|nr:hypothetical protein [Orbaceae bacterium ESL0721]